MLSAFKCKLVLYTSRVHPTTPLSSVLRTTKDHLDALKEMCIFTAEDLLMYLPRYHEDLSSMSLIASSPLNEKVTVRGIVNNIKGIRTKRGKYIVTADFTDHEGESIEVIWYNQHHIKRMLKDDDEAVLTGKIIEKGYKLIFQSPSFEVPRGPQLVHSGKLVPVYQQHSIITAKWLREKMPIVRNAVPFLKETLPAEIIMEEKLMGRPQAIKAMHFPDTFEETQKACERIAFEGMFMMQMDVLKRKQEWQGISECRLMTPMDIELIRAFFASLNFTPTNSQKIAIYEILKDMEKDRPMSRLLEGDVGSGKTLVATAVIANVIKNGGQCAFMVPTEVLAKQHSVTIAKMLVNFHSYLNKGISAEGKKIDFSLPTVELLTGSIPQKKADEIKQRLLNGTVDLVIGPHALITENVVFSDLRLVIVDEQHRFGVEQREKLKGKGNPHFLTMTATPIPRTLALTAHGHHDLSVLLEKPGKRQPIHTKVVSPRDREAVEKFIDYEIRGGRQVFVICPLIQISEHEEMSEIRSVEAEVARLRL